MKVWKNAQFNLKRPPDLPKRTVTKLFIQFEISEVIRFFYFSTDNIQRCNPDKVPGGLTNSETT